MCSVLAMPVPSWAECIGDQSPIISNIRNNLFHEGLFFSNPLGFSIMDKEFNDDNIILQMQIFICHLLIGILYGPNCSYVKSPIDFMNTRQCHSVSLEEFA